MTGCESPTWFCQTPMRELLPPWAWVLIIMGLPALVLGATWLRDRRQR